MCFTLEAFQSYVRESKEEQKQMHGKTKQQQKKNKNVLTQVIKNPKKKI